MEDKKINPRTQRSKEKYEGMIFDSVDGTAKFRINKFNSATDIEIEMVDGLYKDTVTHSDIFHKGIRDPFHSNKEGATCPICFNDPYKEWVGVVVHTNQGESARIINYEGTSKVTVQFQDEYGYIMATTLQNVLKGQLYNPYHKNKYGAYMGEGPFTKANRMDLKDKWKNMLERTLNTADYLAHHGKYTITAYDEVGLVDEWLCFNNFASWYVIQQSILNPNYSYEIDKDLKFFLYAQYTNGKKMYGPNYCVIMPHDLNVSISTIANRSNIQHCLELTEKYYKEQAISLETYQLIYQAVNFYIPDYFKNK